MSKPHIFVVGGYTVGPQMLEVLTEHLAPEGSGIKAADPISFPEGMSNPDKVRQEAKGARVFTISIGALVVQEALPKPERLTMVSGVEPMTIPQQGNLAAQRTIGLARRSMIGPDQEAVRAVLLDNSTEFLRRFWPYYRHLGKISTHSSAATALMANHAGAQVDVVQMENDVYNPPQKHFSWVFQHNGINHHIWDGADHDEPLIRPQHFAEIIVPRLDENYRNL
ncbi:MAG: hypothetical protein R3313_01760 [Candidatus Saccharimonadales bacterium]|nr:hypothetical protein [Candidatus Saccharimonadales bacterium]